MNSEHINAQHQTKRGKETFLSFYLPVACNKALCKLNLLMGAFPNACLLYQSVIGTRCEACAIKSLKNKRIVACNSLHEIMNYALRWNPPVACNLLHEIVNHAPRWNFPVACNLLHEIMNHAPRWNHSCIKMHATHEIMNHALRWNHSCIKMHATHEIMNIRKGLNNVPCVIRSYNKMHATLHNVKIRSKITALYGWLA